MKATSPWLGAVLVAVLAVPTARAQYCGPSIPQAPDCCGPGFYAPNCCGQWYGPNYYLQPAYPPFNGFVFGPQGGRGMAGGPGQAMAPPLNFPTHPYARSPRDFFMVGDENPYAVSSYGYAPAPAGYSAAPIGYSTRPVLPVTPPSLPVTPPATTPPADVPR